MECVRYLYYLAFKKVCFNKKIQSREQNILFWVEFCPKIKKQISPTFISYSRVVWSGIINSSIPTPIGNIFVVVLMIVSLD